MIKRVNNVCNGNGEEIRLNSPGEADWLIKLPYGQSDDCIILLINACMQLLQESYGITEIYRSDYITIGNNASFLVESCQVTEKDDISLDSVLECFNDTKISEEMFKIAMDRT